MIACSRTAIAVGALVVSIVAATVDANAKAPVAIGKSAAPPAASAAYPTTVPPAVRATPPAIAAPAVATRTPTPPPLTVAPPPTAPRPASVAEVQTIGDGDQKLSLVDHGDAWSLHAENLNTDVVFRLWHKAGGPDVVSKTIIDRPFTMSVHQLTAERIVERLLDGYGYTLHYDAKGRLSLVRVYSPESAQIFKTPRLAENLGRWRDVETPIVAPTGATGGGLPAATDASPTAARGDTEPGAPATPDPSAPASPTPVVNVMPPSPASGEAPPAFEEPASEEGQ